MKELEVTIPGLTVIHVQVPGSSIITVTVTIHVTVTSIDERASRSLNFLHLLTYCDITVIDERASNSLNSPQHTMTMTIHVMQLN